AGVKDFLDTHVPEMRTAVAHGQMPSGVLEDIMAAFYDGKYDLLLSTTIIESGLDIPTANTLIVHRADRFGLSQLYQLRGRVGRSKVRAFALFTLPQEGRKITAQAEQRLKVLQSLDTLGAGFQLASHDLDIRGAGNLLGDEQSGHIKEVGFELYQQMLEEAVTSLKAGISAPVADKWSPQITIGTPVMIPEDYVADLPVRLALYRRLAEIEDEREIEAFGAELTARFGPLPSEVEHLLQIVAIKSLCRRANVEKIEAGPKGAVVSFRDNSFANPDRLVAFIRDQRARVRPDQKVVFFDDWGAPEQRLKGTAALLRGLVRLAQPAKAAGGRARDHGIIALLRSTTGQVTPGDICYKGPMRRSIFLLWALTLLPAASPAFAHTGEGITGGFVGGFEHPLLGPDHVVAMVAVGLWGAFLG